MRKVYFLTGTRAEYDILYPVAKACDAMSAMEVGMMVCAAHLSPHHGLGVRQIREDGLSIVAEIETLVSSESWSGRSLSFAHLVAGLTRSLSMLGPDVLVVAGDREEALAGAIVGNLLRIPIAHLFGGDRCIASDVDEVFRPAISKLAHLHFVATQSHRERLLKMGELPETVWVTGATGLDRLRAESDIDEASLIKKYGIDTSQPYFMIIHHPSPGIDELAGEQEMAELLDGIVATGVPAFCSYPNFDPGNIAMRQVIDEYQSRYGDRLVVYHNLPRREFVTLYRRCAAIIGNSSSIVIESGFLKVPGILVGDRQKFRDTGRNVIQVAAKASDITHACGKVLDDEEFLMQVKGCASVYGDGRAASRIAEVLAEHELKASLLCKTITY